MSLIIVDVEADGPVPGLYSMIEIGAVLVQEPLDTTFYGSLKPITKKFDFSALTAIGRTREETFNFNDPKETIQEFDSWLREKCKKPYIALSDNNGFDFAFVNYYFHFYLGYNPFGWSSRNLND
ncbi:MAG: exonuclease, partial [Nanoarchaeota archaeon]